MVSPPLLLDNQPVQDGQVLLARQPVRFAYSPPPGTQPTLLLYTSRTEQPAATRHPHHETWLWHWNPLDYTGAVHLLIVLHGSDGSVQQQQWLLEVLPQHLDQQHYQQVLADLGQVARGLLYAPAHSSVGAVPTVGSAPPDPLAAAYAVVAAQLPVLERVVPRLDPQRTAPHSSSQRTPTARAQRFTHPDWRAAPLPAPPHVPVAGLPASLHEPRPTPPLAPPVLRLVQHILARLAALLAELAVVLAQPPAAQRDLLVQQVAQAQQRVARLRQHPVLRGVPDRVESSTLRQIERQLQQAHLPDVQADVQAVYRCWQALRQPPAIALDAASLRLPIHDLPRLYELWCALQAVQAVAQIGGVLVQARDLFAATASGWRLQLATAHPLLVAGWHGSTLRLWYQPRYVPGGSPYASLDARTHVPDLVLEHLPPHGTPRLLVLDAKYRLDRQGELPPATLGDAYTYLGSIGGADGQRAVRAVLLLYPGTGEALVQYASGVGTVALLPGAAGGLAQAVQSFLAG